MRISRESGARWLPVRIGDFEKWQSGLLEESARRLGAVLSLAAVFTGGALPRCRLHSAASARGCG